jgi:hypothetical protein
MLGASSGNVAFAVNQRPMYVMGILIFAMTVIIAIHYDTRIIHQQYLDRDISPPFRALVTSLVHFPCRSPPPPLTVSTITMVPRSGRNKSIVVPGVNRERPVMIIIIAYKVRDPIIY